MNFCYNYFNFYCMTWMPAYLVEQRGLGTTGMGLYSFLSFAGIAVVAVFGGPAHPAGSGSGSRPKVLHDRRVRLCLHRRARRARRIDQVALFWTVASLSGLGLAPANYNALCRVTLIPASTVGLVTGIEQVATAVAGIVAPIATGWLLHVGGSYELPIDAIFGILLAGALATAFLLRRDWAAALMERSRAARA